MFVVGNVALALCKICEVVVEKQPLKIFAPVCTAPSPLLFDVKLPQVLCVIFTEVVDKPVGIICIDCVVVVE